MVRDDRPTTRGKLRYRFAVPVTIELSKGLFRGIERVIGILVDMSDGGAAIIVPTDPRLKCKKRYRILIDDRAGIIAVRNITVVEHGDLRLGVEVKSLELELQEIVADALDDAHRQASRIPGASHPPDEAVAEATLRPVA